MADYPQSTKGKRMLVTNDDGIHAPGLAVLETIAKALSDDVWIVAPETEQSGAGHSLTLAEPLRLRQIEEKRFAVKGTPTDCVMMGVKHIFGDVDPDLVLSGVNRGANIADDVTYSGTIAGAMEGTQLGIPSIALSQAYGMDGRDKVRWQCAEAHGAAIIADLVKAGWPEHVLINVNFPDCEPGDVKSLQVTSQGKRDESTLFIDERRDGRNQPYYWLAFERKLSNPPQGTDLRAIYDGHISVTPLHLNLTERTVLDHLGESVKDTLQR